MPTLGLAGGVLGRLWGLVGPMESVAVPGATGASIPLNRALSQGCPEEHPRGPGRRVQEPRGCPSSDPLLMVNAAGQRRGLPPSYQRCHRPREQAVPCCRCLHPSCSCTGHRPCHCPTTPSSCPGCPPATLTVALWVTVSPGVPLLQLRWRRRGQDQARQHPVLPGTGHPCPMLPRRMQGGRGRPGCLFFSFPSLIPSVPGPWRPTELPEGICQVTPPAPHGCLALGCPGASLCPRFYLHRRGARGDGGCR